MRTLFLDLASHAGFLACLTTKEVLVSRDIDHRIGDHELVPLIKGLLQEAQWNYDDVTHIACVVGPGGFTSLRVAVAYVNAFAWGLKIPVAGVHLSDLYAARPSPPSPLPAGRGEKGERAFLWLHSTKKHSITPSGLRGAGELFIRGFGIFAEKWPEAVCVSIEDLVGAPRSRGAPLHGDVHWTGELIPEHASILTEHGFQQMEIAPLIDVLPQLLADQKFSTQSLVPWYGRGW